MTFNKHLESRLERVDWDFAGCLSDSPFSALHWHPARLPSQIAGTFIGLLSDPGETVLDPFVGSGTCVTEAQRLGRRGIGIDVNPVSILISKAKTLAISAKTVSGLAVQLRKDAQDILGRPLLSERKITVPPVTVQAKWYTPRVLAELAILWETIGHYSGPSKTLSLMSFSAILLPVCRETRHWGYVCDNSTPRTDHAGDVLSEYAKELTKLVTAYEERDSDRQKAKRELAKVHLKLGSAQEALSKQPRQSVRLLLTSPPYFGVSDYVKSQRLTMEWLGLAIEPIRQREIGARSKRHRTSALEDYLKEMNGVFEAARPVLRDDASCVVILGESSRRAVYIDHFHKSLKTLGYRQVYSTSRNISTQRRQYGSIETESITILTPR